MKYRILLFMLLISSLLYVNESRAAFPVYQNHPVNPAASEGVAVGNIKAEPKDDSDTFAILALVSLFVLPPLAVVFGAIGMNKRRRHHNLALVCLILGAIYTAALITSIILSVNSVGMR